MTRHFGEEALRLIEQVNWKQVALHLTSYADRLIRRHTWGGARPGNNPGGRDTLAMADGRDGQDFAQQAIAEMFDPEADRTWDPEKHKDIPAYLMQAVRSMISNASRRVSNRQTLRQFAETGDPENPIDRIAEAPDPKADTPEAREEAEEEHRQFVQEQSDFAEFKASLADDGELTQLVEAYEADRWKNREIEQLNGIPANRVAELKRKLDRRSNKFLRTRKAG